MGNVVFTSSKGRFIEKALLPLGTDNLVVLLYQSSGLAADATMKNYATVAAIAGGGSTEATFTSYGRKVLSAASITVAFNTGTSTASLDITDQVWSPAGGALNNTLGALVVAYRPTSGSADSAILPISKHDFSGSTGGGTLTATIPSVASAT